jgi:Actinobacteria/chloroflexi VLRF1 release factor
MARSREVAGGGRAVEVGPERLRGWFTRFVARHGELVAVDGTPRRLRFQAADGASAEVAVPFGGLPAGPASDDLVPDRRQPGLDADDLAPNCLHPGADVDDLPRDGLHPHLLHPRADADDTPPDGSHRGVDANDAGAADPGAVLDALHAHLAVPRRVGIVLVRLGGHSVGVAEGGVVQTSSTGSRPVHGRNRKGGSSSGQFARRRDNQARVALDAAADTVARVLLPVADTLDTVVLGGDAAALDDLRADRRLAALLARAEPRVLDVPEPRRAVLDEAARRARAVEVVVREVER